MKRRWKATASRPSGLSIRFEIFVTLVSNCVLWRRTPPYLPLSTIFNKGSGTRIELDVAATCGSCGVVGRFRLLHALICHQRDTARRHVARSHGKAGVAVAEHSLFATSAVRPVGCSARLAARRSKSPTPDGPAGPATRQNRHSHAMDRSLRISGGSPAHLASLHLKHQTCHRWSFLSFLVLALASTGSDPRLWHDISTCNM